MRSKETDKRASSPEASAPNPTRRLVLPLLATTMATLAVGKAQAKQAVAGADAGTIWWSELRTRDSSRAQAFYSGALGWTVKTVAEDDASRPPKPGESGYTLFMMRGQEVAGAEKIEDDDPHPGWFTYVQVDDVDATVRKATALGGKVVQQPTDVPGVGRIGEIEDPEGNRLGLVSPRA
jgi:predicted enzyme related to lactoylglutathione lyase